MAIPLKYNIRNLFVRKITTTMTVFSIGLVVAVFLALMALAAGLDKTFTSSGDPRNLLALRKSSQSEGSSVVTKEEYQILRYLPGIDTGANGQPLVSAEEIVLLNIRRRNQGGESNVIVRGVGPHARLRQSQGRDWNPCGESDIHLSWSACKLRTKSPKRHFRGTFQTDFAMPADNRALFELNVKNVA